MEHQPLESVEKELQKLLLRVARLKWRYERISKTPYLDEKATTKFLDKSGTLPHNWITKELLKNTETLKILRKRIEKDTHRIETLTGVYELITEKNCKHKEILKKTFETPNLYPTDWMSNDPDD